MEAVQTMVDRMKTVLEEAQVNLTVAQSRAKSQVDHLRRNEKFEVGDEVVLSTRHISTNQHLPSKLRRRWIGPYRVTKVISLVAHGLDLPQLGRSILSSMLCIVSGCSWPAQLWHCLGRIGVWFGDWCVQLPSLCDISRGNGAPLNAL